MTLRATVQVTVLDYRPGDPWLGRAAGRCMSDAHGDEDAPVATCCICIEGFHLDACDECAAKVENQAVVL